MARKREGKGKEKIREGGGGGKRRAGENDITHTLSQIPGYATCVSRRSRTRP